MRTLITDNLTGITTEVEVEEIHIIEVQTEPQPSIEQLFTELQNQLDELRSKLWK